MHILCLLLGIVGIFYVFSKSEVRAARVTIILWAGITFILYLSDPPAEPRYSSPPTPQTPVSVSSYTKSDGVYVSSHSRALPGEAVLNSGRTRAWVDHTNALERRYKKKRNQWALICLAIHAVGCFLALRYRTATEQANAKPNSTPAGRVIMATTAPKEVKSFLNAAEQGNAKAQIKLGWRYANGDGVQKNSIEAVKWFRKAAEQGDASAQCLLGTMYAKGEGILQDNTEAVKWWRKAAEQGYALAQYLLGLMYAHGHGVPKDSVEGVKWYHKAAEQGVEDAQSNLGLMYAEGNGIAKDSVEAVKWWQKAAVQGNSSAQSYLGVMYAEGEGVQRDAIEGLAWSNIAAASGSEIFVENRDMLERYLGTEVTLAAQQRSKQILKEIEDATKKVSLKR